MSLDLAELRGLLADWQSFEDDDNRAVLEELIDHAVVLPAGARQSPRCRLAHASSHGPKFSREPLLIAAGRLAGDEREGIRWEPLTLQLDAKGNP